MIIEIKEPSTKTILYRDQFETTNWLPVAFAIANERPKLDRRENANDKPGNYDVYLLRESGDSIVSLPQGAGYIFIYFRDGEIVKEKTRAGNFNVKY